MKITHLHNAVRRDINNQTSWFNIIIDMEDESLSSLYVNIGRAEYFNLYPDYLDVLGNEIVGKRGVLIENINPMDTIDGRLTMTDIDNMKHTYPNMLWGNVSSEYIGIYKPKTYLEKIIEELIKTRKKIEEMIKIELKY